MLESLLNAVESDDRILAVMLYGSRAREDAREDSDTDISLVLRADQDPRVAGAAVQLEYLRFHDLDIRVYQRLPIYIRQRVLKDGRVLFVKDEDELYEIAFRTVRDFEDYRPFYLAYLDEVANG